MCTIGKRLLKDIVPENCTKTIGGELYNVFCNATSGICDEYYQSKFFNRK